MSRRLDISALLNAEDIPSDPSTVDVRDIVNTLVASVGPSGPVRVPPAIAAMLSQVVTHITPIEPVPEAPVMQQPAVLPFAISSFPSHPTPSIQRDIKMNKKTTITTLFTLNDVHAYIEYPETGPENLRPVGYLFRCDPESWQSPVQNFAYSLGGPCGGTKKGVTVNCKLLRDGQGNEVPCIERHYKCMSFRMQTIHGNLYLIL